MTVLNLHVDPEWFRLERELRITCVHIAFTLVIFSIWILVLADALHDSIFLSFMGLLIIVTCIARLNAEWTDILFCTTRHAEVRRVLESPSYISLREKT